MIKFYEGGLAYDVAKSLSFYELQLLNAEANRINREITAEMKSK